MADNDNQKDQGAPQQGGGQQGGGQQGSGGPSQQDQQHERDEDGE